MATDKSNLNRKSRYSTAPNDQYSTEEAIILEYFRLIKNKDIDKLLGLFADDAIIYEPFSKTGDSDGLQGKTAIESFLNIAIMANSGLNHQIEIIKSNTVAYNNNEQITANVIFERGEKVKSKFIFEISSENHNFHKQKKIKSLRIQFSSVSNS